MKSSQFVNLDNAIINSLDVGIVVFSKKFEIIKANPKAYEFLSIKNTAIETLNSGSELGWEAILTEAINSGQPFTQHNMEYRSSTASLLDVLVLPLRDSYDQDAVGLLQISEVRQNLNEPIAGAAKNDSSTMSSTELRLAAMGQQLSKIVHEINNSIDGTKRFVNLALRALSKNNTESAKSCIETCKVGLGKMEAVAGKVLEFAKNSKKEQKLHDIHELLDDSLECTSFQLNEKKIRVRKYFDAKLSLLPYGNLYNVFVNMIKNAVEAMGEAGILSIKTYNLDNDRFAIEFEDTGHGVDEELEQNIFEPFVTTKGFENGTGLGLAICNDIIKFYGGKIEIHKAQTEGSIFKIILPASQEVQ